MLLWGNKTDCMKILATAEMLPPPPTHAHTHIFGRFSQFCEKRLLVSSCLSLRMQQLVFQWKDSLLNLIFEDFWKICIENSSFNKIGQEQGVIFMKTNISSCITSCSFLLRMRNISEKVVEKIKTHILCQVTNFFFFWKSRRLWENVGEKKYFRAC